MSNFLLDTHVVLWLLFDVDKIPNSTLQKIKNLDNEIYISAVSFWEISIKYSLNKLDLNKLNVSELPQIFKEQGYKSLPLNVDDTASFWELKLVYHKDLFDRILIWQAIKNNFTLISNDVNMSPYRTEGLQLLW
ncbi:type II toxin-antitoxin system VapC family toxin [Flavobacterium sp.]|uniref:type II toxin-antitoxin system VapC family toxin n=1 Tax=Flavobacterium sp. TaxID=239 RepID=UPI0037527463